MVNVRNSLSRETINFTYNENAMPKRIGDLNSAVGGITLQVPRRNGINDLTLYNQDINIFSGTNATSGTVNSVTTGLADTNLTIDHAMIKFNFDATVLPFVGTFANAMAYYCDVVGITTTLNIDSAVAAREVVNPGWNGNVWQHLKMFFAVQQVEMVYNINPSTLAETLVIRELGQRTINFAGITDDKSLNIGTPASQYITINTYGNYYVEQGEVYAPDDGTIYSVEARQTFETEITLDAYVISVNQPVCSDWVNNRAYDNSDGVYSVVGNDGLPLTAAQWTSQGGFLEVQTTDDPRVIKLIIKGADYDELSPFRIAMSSGNYYNSLHITAEAVLREEGQIQIYTGAPPNTVSETSELVISNIFVPNASVAYQLGQFDSLNASGMLVTGNWGVSGIDQGWSDITGSRFKYGNKYYRVVGYSENNLAGSVIFESDTTIADFDAVWGSGTTIADIDAVWANTSLLDISVDILKGP